MGKSDLLEQQEPLSYMRRDRSWLSWLNGLRRRPVSAFAVLLCLSLVGSVLALAPTLLSLAQSSVDGSARVLARVPVAGPGDVRGLSLRENAESHLAEARAVLSSWRTLEIVASVLVVLAILMFVGILSKWFRGVLHIGPLAVLAAGIAGLSGNFAVSSDLDEGLTSTSLRSFSAAVLLLTFAAALDQTLTQSERHEEIRGALEGAASIKAASTAPTARFAPAVRSGNRRSCLLAISLVGAATLAGRVRRTRSVRRSLGG